MKKLLVITDFDSLGSGYKNICVPLFTEMSKMDYDIKIIGLQYHGEEHNHPFSVIPSMTIQESHTIASNVIQIWSPDVVIVAMDLPHQEQFYSNLSRYFERAELPKIKYIAITPLENGPLCLDWAIPLYNMDGVFFISELGKQEALKVGVKADHLQVGVDTVSWRPPYPEEKKQLREGLGIPQDAFVVLTVADNQERKNLWGGMDTIAKLKKNLETDPLENVKSIKYILVTREHNPYGNKLRSLATTLGINQELSIYERGMPQQNLWALYAVADAYLQPSKAEGLGLPVLDAMCCKVPVVATDTGALHELLMDYRGFLTTPEYIFTDVWGNSDRAMIDRVEAMTHLRDIASTLFNHDWIEYAHEFVSKKTWDIPAKQLHTKITELLG